MGNKAKRPGSGRHIDSINTDESSSASISSCEDDDGGDGDCDDGNGCDGTMRGTKGDGSISIGVSMGAYGVTISTAYEDELLLLLLLLLLVVPMGSLDGRAVCEEG